MPDWANPIRLLTQSNNEKSCSDTSVCLLDDGILTSSQLASHPGYIVRLAGGSLFAFGMLLMACNTWRTVLAGAHDVQAPIHGLAMAKSA